MGITEWLEEATPDRREVTVCLDRRLVSELVKVNRELAELEATANPGMLQRPKALKDLRARATDLEEQVRGKSRVLVFEGLGWGKWRDLMASHPPAKDQDETFRRAVQLAFMPHAVENVGYNAETFVPAAIAASCVEPGMTIHQADTLLRKAPPGVIERVWAAVLEANIAGGNDPFVAAASAGNSGSAIPSAKK